MTDVEGDGDGAVRYIERPSAEAAATAVETALARGRVVTLVGECRVDAEEGGLHPASRHVLVKPDGTIVVHGRDGPAPALSVAGDDGPAVTADDDVLEVAPVADPGGRRLRFDRVDLLIDARVDPTIFPADETAESVGPGGREGRPAASTDRDREGGRDHDMLRERLLAEPDRLDPGFRPLSTERETPAGSVDLFGRDAEGRAVVVEIKAHRAGPAAVGQLDRYVAALRRDLHADAEVRGILVAPSATDRTRRLLEERGFSFRALSLPADGP